MVMTGMLAHRNGDAIVCKLNPVGIIRADGIEFEGDEAAHASDRAPEHRLQFRSAECRRPVRFR